MSLHKSLSYRISKTGRRNVLTRRERVDILSATGKLSEKDSVFGLPKVKPSARRLVFRRASRAASEETPAEG